MKTWAKNQTNQMKSQNKKLTIAAIVMAVVALIGFIDASYLTAEHLLGGTPACTVLEGCEIVTTSEYSTIGPIPIALLGSLYYLAVILGAVLFIDRKNKKVLKLVSLLPIAGFATSLSLVYLMLFVLDAICIYCMGSALSSTTLFIVGIYILLKMRKTKSVDG